MNQSIFPISKSFFRILFMSYFILLRTGSIVNCSIFTVGIYELKTYFIFNDRDSIVNFIYDL